MKVKQPPAAAIILTLVLSLLFLSNTAQGTDSALPLSLFQAIDARLGYMNDVALFKAQNKIPIEDVEREEIVLSDAKTLAATHGLDPDSMQRFFNAQINAAKAIQYRYRAELLTRETSRQAVDLQSEIRPELDRLGSDIVSLFATLLQSQFSLQEESRESFNGALQNRLLTDADREALFDAMLDVRLSP